MRDLGAERSERGEAIELVNFAIEPLDARDRESGCDGSLQPVRFSLELARMRGRRVSGPSSRTAAASPSSLAIGMATDKRCRWLIAIRSAEPS